MGARCGRDKVPHDPSAVSRETSACTVASQPAVSSRGARQRSAPPATRHPGRKPSRNSSELNRLRTTRRKGTFDGSSICHNLTDIGDNYDMGDKEGEGTQGVVFRAKRKKTGVQRAVKKVSKGSTPKEQERLHAEIELMQRMDHPNIVKLYETFQDKRFIYIVMEICNGGELFDKIVSQGAFSEQEAAIVMQQVLRAVHYMHGQDICHRDLKPENFLFLNKGPIDEDNLIKLIDFGIAIDCGPDDILSDMMGTPYYMAPQVLTRRYNRSCDLWSIGCILHVLLQGNVPFGGNSDKEILAKVRTGILQMKEENWRHVSEEARDLVKKLLTRNPKERITAEQALSHDWIKLRAPHAEGTLQINLIENLRHFRCKNRLKKVALALLANHMDDEQLKKLREAFTALDANGDGLLTIAEIKAGIEEGGFQIPDDLQDIITEVDENGSGVIDYTEFLAATINTENVGMISKEACRTAFGFFDVDGDGKIDKQELHRVLDKASGSGRGARSRAMSDDLMERYDKDGDGQINFEEFCTMLHDSSCDINKAANESKRCAEDPCCDPDAQEFVSAVASLSIAAEKITVHSPVADGKDRPSAASTGLSSEDVQVSVKQDGAEAEQRATV